MLPDCFFWIYPALPCRSSTSENAQIPLTLYLASLDCFTINIEKMKKEQMKEKKEKAMLLLTTDLFPCNGGRDSDS